MIKNFNKHLSFLKRKLEKKHASFMFVVNFMPAHVCSKLPVSFLQEDSE